MSVLFILMAVSIVLGGAFLALFVWAVRSGQFDDTGTPPLRMLADRDGEGAARMGKTTRTTKRNEGL